jgi:single-strand DNA-binding protein
MAMAYLALIGNLGRDPEMSYTSTGIAVTKFSLAVSQKRGEKEETAWYNCVAWRGLAETLNQHLRKGQQVYVAGEFFPRSYTTKDGRSGMVLEITVEKFQFLGGKPKETAAVDIPPSDDLGELDNVPF